MATSQTSKSAGATSTAPPESERAAVEQAFIEVLRRRNPSVDFVAVRPGESVESAQGRRDG